MILAHVNGPSGSGKTTIGHVINEKYPFIKNIDIDDVLIHDLPTMFPKSYIKHMNNNEKEVFNKKFIYKGLERAIKPYEYVILVGNIRILDKDTGKFHNLENVDTQNKFVIDINEDLLLERRIKRHFKFLAEHDDRYYKKIMKKGKLEINLDLWKGERLYWGHSREKFYEKSIEDGYELLDQNTIIDKLSTIIENEIKS